MLTHKSLAGSSVKFLDKEGSVRSVISTFGVVDKDGDVTKAGFFGEQTAAIVWSHDWHTMVGKGIITEQGDEAVFEGDFFLETAAGSEAYKTTKAMGELMEWSYGFRILEGGSTVGEFDGKQVRFLQPKDDGSPGAKVDEVSPVLVGAGEGTRTMDIKTGMNDRNLRFVEQAILVAQEAELLVARAKEIHDLRGKLGAESTQTLKDVQTRLSHAATDLGSIAAPPDTHPDEARAVLMHAQRELAAVHDLTRYRSR